MKDDILQEIEKLKLMVLMDMGCEKKSDVERYEEWVDKMQGRGLTCKIFTPEKWATHRTIRSLVEDLYYKKHGYEYDYNEKKPEIRRVVAEAVAMTLFVQDENKCLACRFGED